MKVISEIVDGEKYLELILTEKECKAITGYKFMTKVIKMVGIGKPVNLAIYRQIDGTFEEEEENYAFNQKQV